MHKGYKNLIRILAYVKEHGYIKAASITTADHLNMSWRSVAQNCQALSAAGVLKGRKGSGLSTSGYFLTKDFNDITMEELDKALDIKYTKESEGNKRPIKTYQCDIEDYITDLSSHLTLGDFLDV